MFAIDSTVRNAVVARAHIFFALGAIQVISEIARRDAVVVSVVRTSGPRCGSPRRAIARFQSANVATQVIARAAAFAFCVAVGSAVAARLAHTAFTGADIQQTGVSLRTAQVVTVVAGARAAVRVMNGAECSRGATTSTATIFAIAYVLFTLPDTRAVDLQVKAKNAGCAVRLLVASARSQRRPHTVGAGTDVWRATVPVCVVPGIAGTTDVGTVACARCSRRCGPKITAAAVVFAGGAGVIQVLSSWAH